MIETQNTMIETQDTPLTQKVKTLLENNKNCSLQEFAIVKFCKIYVTTINNKTIKHLGFNKTLIKAFIKFSDTIQFIENQKDSNGKMNINDLKKAINKFNKSLVDNINYENDYKPDSHEQKPSFDEALPEMFQKADDNQITIVDVLKQNFEAVMKKNAKEEKISWFYKQSTIDLADSFVKINKFLKESGVDLDKDLATGPFKTIMLYLIQPICQIFENQEWAKNLIAEKESIKSVPQFKHVAKLIAETAPAAKSMKQNQR